MNLATFLLLNYYDTKSRIGEEALVDKLTEKVLNNTDLIDQLRSEGYLTKEELTQKGQQALSGFCVKRAIILAAGMATRFVPLSLEKPKALFEVKGERLIERQIRQLQAVGITDITIVIGYQKEQFEYLKHKFGVTLVENADYFKKNNITSLLCVSQQLGDSYICSSDNYFVKNPFHHYELHSFYAGYETQEQQADEMYAIIDNDHRITQIEWESEGGYLMMGHAYWTDEFAQQFLSIAQSPVGKRYDQKLWEWMLADHVKDFPTMYLKAYSPATIYEFDYFEELRIFDEGYKDHSKCEILRNIKLVFRCDEEDIIHFRRVSEGMTNTSFVFQIQGEDYIYRHPGKGTEKIINRQHEKHSLQLAEKIGVDPTYIYMDSHEGWKISRYIPKFRMPDYHDKDDSMKIITALRKLHQASLQVDYGMRPWEDALAIEKLYTYDDATRFTPYQSLKEKIERLYQKTKGDGVKKCFCHGDTYQPNWMIQPDGKVILIDWEYAGYSDPGIDVGYYIVDAAYDVEEAEWFVHQYLREDNPTKEFHFMAYVAIIAYYWFVWALYRESCGAYMGEAIESWRSMAEKYANYMLGIEEK